MTVTGNFERFQYFNLGTNLLENENLFEKTGVALFQFNAVRLKIHYVHIKLSHQKPMLRHITMVSTK